MRGALGLDLKRELILASASPRRRELLTAAGLPFKVIPPNADETAAVGELPQELVRRLAEMKAQSVSVLHPAALVLGADTIVVLDGEILGKPVDQADACRMLGLLQGREHIVYGGIALLCAENNLREIEHYESRVRIAPLDSSLIARYVSTGEPLDKAGAYAIQGLGAQLVAEVFGSYSNVVGLNMAALRGLLELNNF